MRAFTWLLLAFLLWPGHILSVAMAGEQTTPAKVEKSIPFKTEKQGFGSTILRTIIVFIFVIALVVAGLYVLGKYFPGLYVSSKFKQHAAQQTLNVVEIKRLTPRTTLFVVEYGDKTLLLGQAGDSISLLDSAPNHGEVGSGLTGGNA